MITYVVGDLFTSPAKVLVNTVNTVGVMGKGIAKDFKRIYPEMFEEYQYFCEQGMFNVGQLWLYKTPHKWILNFPTKKHWRSKSKIDYIEAGLRKFADTYDSKGMLSVSFPMLGCGNGELDWEKEVQSLMENYLADLPIDIYIHLYKQNALFVPEHRNIKEIRKWLHGEPRYLPFAEFWDDVKEITASKQDFVSLDNRTRFTASLGLFEQNLGFEWDSEEFLIGKESLEELWRLIRSKGYFLISDFPDDVTRYVYIIISFLTDLPYVQPILLSNRPKVTDQDIGLRLVAQASERKSRLQKVKLA